MSPVGPVVPVGPGPPNPVAPVAPVAPVGPVAPVAPVGPVAPVAPRGPVGPVAPRGPVGPVDPPVELGGGFGCAEALSGFSSEGAHTAAPPSAAPVIQARRVFCSSASFGVASASFGVSSPATPELSSISPAPHSDPDTLNHTNLFQSRRQPVASQPLRENRTCRLPPEGPLIDLGVGLGTAPMTLREIGSRQQSLGDLESALKLAHPPERDR